MSASQIDRLELRAIAQRNHLHKTAADIKEKLNAARAEFNLERQARNHFAGAAIAAAAITMLAGYATGGVLKGR